MKKKVTLILLSLMTSLPIFSQKIIAHRGFWKTEGAAQNSLASLKNADSIHCYGSEFDVRLTADNQLVVCHEASIKGKKIERSTLDNLTSLRLSNGEYLPTLESYLQEARKTISIRLILELKPHSTPERESIAVREVTRLVQKYELEDQMEYISFSLHIVKEFLKINSKNKVYYLKGNLTPLQLKELGCTGLDYSLQKLKRHPDWIKEAHELGLKVNIWTVNKEKNMKWAINNKVDFITTDEPELLKRLLIEAD